MNFDGILPSKENVMDIHQPNIRNNFDVYEWQVTNDIRVKQQLEPYVRKRTL